MNCAKLYPLGSTQQQGATFIIDYKIAKVLSQAVFVDANHSDEKTFTNDEAVAGKNSDI